MTISRSLLIPASDRVALDAETSAMAAELRQTLTDTPAWIPSKYLYDDRGSRLFDAITGLPEYYPTRTEEALLEASADAIVAAADPVEIVELGSGVGRKIRALLDRVMRRHGTAHLVLVDINEGVLAESSAALRRAYPGLDVTTWVADFEREAPRVVRRGRRMMVFFAGTIGNLHPDSVPSFLRAQAAALAPGDSFLVGVDLVKDRARLEAAYNDAQGVTARFNLNVLQVLNDRLGADFPLAAFEHVAFFDSAQSWIEMRVRARRSLHVTIPACRLELTLQRGDAIRTEISCKYTRETFAARVAGTGLAVADWLTDPEGLFALVRLVRTGDRRRALSADTADDERRAALETVWRRSDALFAMLAPDALLAQPIALRQPFLFYLGHLPAFAWNQVMRGALGRPSFHPGFDQLFERGIDPVGVDRYEPRAEWPDVGAVEAYRDRCRAALREAPRGLGFVQDMVLEHERMHHETLLYMIQQLPIARKRRPADWPALPRFGPGLASHPIEIPAGRATLGASFGSIPFGWDNEFPEHIVDVPGFWIDACPVTHRELAAFVEAGGYEMLRLWTDSDWAWKERAGVRHPTGWRRGASGEWIVRGLFDEWPLERVAGWPASVSGAEARAYAAWRGARLPTEAEIHRAAFSTPEGRERAFPWGDDAERSDRGNFGFREGGPVPTGTYPRGASAWGVHELVGNGWEWTSTPFHGFPGFTPYMTTYPGYSQDFFDGAHFVLKGASWATGDALVRRTFRNWFQPHYPYVFAKFRCAGAR